MSHLFCILIKTRFEENKSESRQGYINIQKYKENLKRYLVYPKKGSFECFKLINIVLKKFGGGIKKQYILKIPFNIKHEELRLKTLDNNEI